MPSGWLDAALEQWVRQSVQQLLYAGRLVAGKRSYGLSGRYGPGDALQRLLLGSGLKPERLNPQTLVLKTEPMPVEPATDVQPEADAASPKVTDLGQVHVTGTRIRGADVSSPMVTITPKQIRLAGHNNPAEAQRVWPHTYSLGPKP